MQIYFQLKTSLDLSILIGCSYWCLNQSDNLNAHCQLNPKIDHYSFLFKHELETTNGKQQWRDAASLKATQTSSGASQSASTSTSSPRCTTQNSRCSTSVVHAPVTDTASTSTASPKPTGKTKRKKPAATSTNASVSPSRRGFLLWYSLVTRVI